MNTLMHHLGYNADSKLELALIAANLQGTMQLPVRLYESLFAAQAVYEYLCKATWWGPAGMNIAEADDTTKEFQQGTYFALAEMFSSAVWGRSNYAEITMLGYQCSEEDGYTELPDDWYNKGWEVVHTSIAGWSMERQYATGGCLYRIGFSDEGFNYDIWLFAKYGTKLGVDIDDDL